MLKKTNFTCKNLSMLSANNKQYFTFYKQDRSYLTDLSRVRMIIFQCQNISDTRITNSCTYHLYHTYKTVYYRGEDYAERC
jgi:broad-specificity NMP kinase